MSGLKGRSFPSAASAGHNQSFRPFVALELNGKPALTLEKYNQWSEENQKTAHWVLPILFCCCLGLLWSGVQKRKMAR